MLLEEIYGIANFFSIILKLILKATIYTLWLMCECKFMETKHIICVYIINKYTKYKHLSGEYSSIALLLFYF